MDWLSEAQEYGELCGVCGTYVPSLVPLYVGKLRSDSTGGYYKVPYCGDCIENEDQLWGTYQRFFSGRELDEVKCCVCSRLLIGYFLPDEDAFCSRGCRRKTYSHG